MVEPPGGKSHAPDSKFDATWFNLILCLPQVGGDDQKNLLVVKGSVPGKPGSIINIKPNNVVGKKGGEKS